jgi:hypothetical protein
MLSKRERLEVTAEARARGAVAQLAFGPNAERRRLLAAPIYKVPPPAHLPECHGFADGWGCEQGCPIAEAYYASLPVLPLTPESIARLYDVPVELLNDAANRRAE